MTTISSVPALDPNLFTGPSRLMGGVSRMGTVSLDTPYGSNGLPEFARWLYIGVSGDVNLVKWDGTTQVLKGVAAGIWHPIYSIQINSASTTATNMVWGS